MSYLAVVIGIVLAEEQRSYPWWSYVISIPLILLFVGAWFFGVSASTNDPNTVSGFRSQCSYCGKRLKIVNGTGGARRYRICHHCGRDVTGTTLPR